MERNPLKVCEIMHDGNLIKFPRFAILDGEEVIRLKAGRNRKIGERVKYRFDKDGYRVLWLSTGLSGKEIRYLVRFSRLAAHYFYGPCPKGKQVNHKDGNKQNDSKTNLEYVTATENSKHAYKIGLQPHQAGEDSPNHKLTYLEVRRIRTLWAKGVEKYQLSKIFDITPQHVIQIILSKRWKQGGRFYGKEGRELLGERSGRETRSKRNS